MRNGELGRAAAGDEVGRLVEVDVQPRRERDRLFERVAAAGQLGEAPADHFGGVGLVEGLELRGGHVVQTREAPRRYTAVSPPSTAQIAPVT